MKIDLYNNYETFCQERKQDSAVQRYCHGIKISMKKLQSHPCVADVATLIMFDPYDTWMTEKDQQIWRHTWAWVYHKELPLNQYHKRKLNSILDSIQHRQRTIKHMKKAITMTSKKGRLLPDRLIGLEQQQ
jgi:hypothetical protein